MKAQSFSNQWQTQRKKRLVFAVCMLILLLLATIFLGYARQNLRQSQIDAAISQRAYQEAIWTEEEVKDVALLNEKAQQMMQSAVSRGLSPNDWAERRINLKQAQLTRNEANELLLSIARTKERLFSVEEFDISVARDDEGIFNVPSRPNTPLVLTVRGTAVFRTGK